MLVVHFFSHLGIGKVQHKLHMYQQEWQRNKNGWHLCLLWTEPSRFGEGQLPEVTSDFLLAIY